MTYSLDNNGSIRVGQHRNESVVTNAEFVVVGRYETLEEASGVGRSAFELCNYPVGNRRIQPVYIMDGRCGPAD